MLAKGWPLEAAMECGRAEALSLRSLLRPGGGVGSSGGGASGLALAALWSRWPSCWLGLE